MWGELSEPRWVLFVLVAARVLPIALFSPLCGGKNVPLFMRTALGLLVTIPVALGLPLVPLAAPLWVLLVKELLIGAALSLGVSLFFEAISGAGALVDAMAGRGSPESLATTAERHDSPVRTFALLFALAAFSSMGGIRVVVSALAESFAAAPPAAMPPEAALLSITGSGVLTMGVEYFRAVLLLAAPVMAILLLTDLVIAVLSRLLAPMNGFIAGLTIKPLLAVLLCGLLLLAAIESYLPTLGRSLSGTNRQLFSPTP